MTVWIGNTPEVVTFEPGKLPSNTQFASTPSQMPSEDEGHDDEDDEADSDGSNEIDRGLEQDQYRGE